MRPIRPVVTSQVVRTLMPVYADGVESKLEAHSAKAEQLLLGRNVGDYHKTKKLFHNMSLLIANKDLNIKSASHVATTMTNLSSDLTPSRRDQLTSSLSASVFETANAEHICPVLLLLMRKKGGLTRDLLNKTVTMLNNVLLRPVYSHLSSLSWYMLVAASIKDPARDLFFKRNSRDQQSPFYDILTRMMKQDPTASPSELKSPVLRILLSLELVSGFRDPVGPQVVNLLLHRVLSDPKQCSLTLFELKNVLRYLSRLKKADISWNIYDCLSCQISVLDQLYYNFELLTPGLRSHPGILLNGTADIVFFGCKLFANRSDISSQRDVALSFFFRVSELTLHPRHEARKFIGFGHHPDHELTGRLYRNQSAYFTTEKLMQLDEVQRNVLSECFAEVAASQGIREGMHASALCTHSTPLTSLEEAVWSLCKASAKIETQQRATITYITTELDLHNVASSSLLRPLSEAFISMSTSLTRDKVNYFKPFLVSCTRIISSTLTNQLDSCNTHPLVAHSHIFDLVHATTSLCTLVRRLQQLDNDPALGNNIDEAMCHLLKVLLNAVDIGKWTDSQSTKRFVSVMIELFRDISRCSKKPGLKSQLTTAEDLLKVWLSSAPVSWDPPYVLIGRHSFGIYHFRMMFQSRRIAAGLTSFALLESIKMYLVRLRKDGGSANAIATYREIVAAFVASKVTNHSDFRLHPLADILRLLWDPSWPLHTAIREVKMLMPMFTAGVKGHSFENLYSKLSTTVRTHKKSAGNIRVFIPHLAELWNCLRLDFKSPTYSIWDLLYTDVCDLIKHQGVSPQCVCHLVGIYSNSGLTVETDYESLVESCAAILIEQRPDAVLRSRKVDYSLVPISFMKLSVKSIDLYEKIDNLITRNNSFLSNVPLRRQLAHFYKQIGYQSKLL
eukprot:TRINITY_DN10467_c0_g2_i1.p1 TRINITY_DN10467_c0_g2~~TRINITY_DN10467_c0_g2_i1.p1  ORF type:complete len:902 (+),score=63.07 TRINITY_DN10467_c0_g2_i1:125-2830(+)